MVWKECGRCGRVSFQVRKATEVQESGVMIAKRAQIDACAAVLHSLRLKAAVLGAKPVQQEGWQQPPHPTSTGHPTKGWGW